MAIQLVSGWARAEGVLALCAGDAKLLVHVVARQGAEAAANVDEDSRALYQVEPAPIRPPPALRCGRREEGEAAFPASPGHPRFFPSLNGSPSLYRSGWLPSIMQAVLTRRTSVQEPSADSASCVRDGISMPPPRARFSGATRRL
eukprot:CAMPEP_0119090954 /NCGR_PEP_ID=MMETSP1178-20130426/154655_1 /TAXON_ID=33656 /ORGANISM="unid sp, Strain CCMP2000" /LENGTH=144 /DNA_ID=CAMNT_0007074415 /DNA_START=348 /DNA_END=780 /DNA_ORIENTATION=-